MPSVKRVRTRVTNTEAIWYRNCGTFPQNAKRDQRTIWRAEVRRRKETAHPGRAAEKLSLYQTVVSRASPFWAIYAAWESRKRRDICRKARFWQFLLLSLPFWAPKNIFRITADLYRKKRKKRWPRFAIVSMEWSHSVTISQAIHGYHWFFRASLDKTRGKRRELTYWPKMPL